MRYDGPIDELQIQIEDTALCLGTCPGCILSTVERKSGLGSRQPLLGTDLRRTIFARLHDYVAMRPPKRISLAFGIGDHLLLPDDYLTGLYGEAEELILESGADRETSFITFTVSLIGDHDHTVERLQKLAMAVRHVPLIPQFVADPTKLTGGKFATIYARNIEAFRSAFPRIDVALNLSNGAVRAMEADAFYAFAADGKFGELAVNWVPTPRNFGKTATDMMALGQWLTDFDMRARKSPEDGISASYRSVFADLMAGLREDFGMTRYLSPEQVIERYLPRILASYLYIDTSGNLLPRFEAVGDIFQGERFGYDILGSVRDNSIESLVEAAYEPVKRRILKAIMGHSICRSCAYAGACAATGFHIVNRAVGSVPRDAHKRTCPSMAYDLFQHFDATGPLETDELAA